MSVRGLALFLALAGAAADVPPLAVERRVFDLVNLERHRRGLQDLKWSAPLAEEARRHSARMATLWFFSHDDPERGALAKRLKEAGIRYRRCGENIFDEKGYPDPALQAVRGWMSSPGHRDMMLSPLFTHAGVGAAVRADGAILIAEDFMTP